VEEQGADEISGQPISLGHFRFTRRSRTAANFFRFSEHDLYDSVNASRTRTPNHREHAHVFQRRYRGSYMIGWHLPST
jgi:hypothetical protein